MRIAHFLNDYTESGGTERAASNLCYLFWEQDFEAPIIFSFTPVNATTFFPYPPGSLYFSFSKNDPLLIEKINALCLIHNLDVIIFHGYHLLLFTQSLSKLDSLSRPLVLVTHFSTKNFTKVNLVYPFWRYLPVNLYKMLRFHLYLKQKYKTILTRVLRVGKIVCVSEKCASELRDIFSNNIELKHNIYCIHNPLMLKMEGPTAKEDIVLYVGRIRNRKKNIMLLVNSWAIIQKNCPGWQLFIVGDGDALPEVARQIRRRGIKNIVQTGRIENVSSFYCRAQISACPSSSDALPQFLVESVFFGNAILTTAFDGGHEEVVQNGINGFVVPKNSVRLFSEKLLYLIHNDAVRKTMAGNSGRVCLEKFGRRQVMERWEELLLNLLQRSTGIIQRRQKAPS